MSDLEPLDFQLALRAFRYLRDSDDFAPSWARFRHVYDDRAKVGRGAEVPELLQHLPERMTPEASAEYRAERAQRIAERKEADLRARALELIGPSKWTPLQHPDTDPLAPMLTYDEVYENGEPRPEYRADVEQYKHRWPVA